jgi:hypothetical protein
LPWNSAYPACLFFGSQLVPEEKAGFSQLICRTILSQWRGVEIDTMSSFNDNLPDSCDVFAAKLIL